LDSLHMKAIELVGDIDERHHCKLTYQRISP